MALRRLAQENNAASSPRSPAGPIPASPASGLGPTTPRSRLSNGSYGFHRSPADTPSISSSIPFDWEAARSRAPAPFATPLKKGRKSVATGTSTPRKAVIRKKGIIERIKNIPSAIAFEIAIFPQNVPLPTPKTTARIIGGAIHVAHFLILARNDNEENWDLVSGTKQSSWFDWTTPITLLLILFSVYNTYNLATRRRTYKFHHRMDPLSSPHAKFVVTNLDLEPLARPAIGQRIRSNLWFYFSYFWRFLFGMQPPTRPALPQGKTSRVQELEVWEPSEMDLELFSIYSPAHAVLWLSMGSSSWLYSVVIMGIVGLQLNVMTHSYTQLLKDKQIIAAETMKEYNDGFVYPRINPIRKDVAVMTHQSEVVNVWED
ncbi:Meiotically up-regulated gene 154 protein [Psilocybe cubensis]|uniref:Uncharacterized protein n=2 Tax=Psilocybe cubensis TaxID=181762 RepID=A0A8H8CP27_PSICU|nr:Meiotically up-regulated gene 154 protein [Psilocybe cubensis]KAH9484263.1 Meiotically up-regulated gene 154 protein [Psilocybe cubensis]